MQDQIFLGRQPILDPRQNTVAYELLFRGGNTRDSNVTDDLLATANVIINTISQIGIDNVLNGRLGFLNVSHQLLMSDLLELLPPKHMVLEILETVEIDDNVIARCKELKAAGFKIALDDFVYNPSYDPLFEIIEIIKYDVMLSPWEEIAESLKIIRKYPHISFLAEKVEKLEEFEHYLNEGFSLFQGYFFAKPTVITAKKANPSQATLLRVMGMIQKDEEPAQIQKVFKESPHLSISLLRLVNSVGMGLRNKVGSLQQALVVLGQRQLLRWVQLLLYSQGSDSTSSPIFELAAVRGRFMELVALALEKSSPQARGASENAFMTGILSLVDVVLNMKLEDIIQDLGLIEDVNVAVLERKGFLGSLLVLSEKMEIGDFDTVSKLAEDMGLSADQITQAQLEAIQWVENLGNETPD